MRCKLCGKTQHIQRNTHSWRSSQHCGNCHFMGRIPRGRKAKDYPKKSVSKLN